MYSRCKRSTEGIVNKLLESAIFDEQKQNLFILNQFYIMRTETSDNRINGIPSGTRATVRQCSKGCSGTTSLLNLLNNYLIYKYHITG